MHFYTNVEVEIAQIWCIQYIQAYIRSAPGKQTSTNNKKGSDMGTAWRQSGEKEGRVCWL